MKQPIVLTPTQLRRAADLQESIESQQRELTSLLIGKAVTFKSNGKATKVVSAGGKRVMTPEQKEKIAAGLRAKWAARKAANPTAPTASTTTVGA